MQYVGNLCVGYIFRGAIYVRAIVAGGQSMFGQVAMVEAMETIAIVTDTHPGAKKVIISKSIIMIMVILSKFTLSVSSASQQGAATWYGESCPSTLTSTFR